MFYGLNTFMKVNNTNTKFQIIGMPIDFLTSHRPGTRFGPEAIRKASSMICDEDGIHPIFRNDPANDIEDLGDIPIDITNQKLNMDKLYETCIKSNHPIVLGGDHSLSYATIKAATHKYGKINVIHFDAHCDLWKGDLSHGSFFTKLYEENLINKLFQIGIRSPEPKHYRQFAKDNNIQIYDARILTDLNKENLIKISKHINAILNDEPTYLTFDIDCLDPAFAPGTGTPEIGGLSSWQALTMLENFEINFIGMDMVEVSPAYDVAEITATAAATLVWTYICNVNAKK